MADNPLDNRWFVWYSGTGSIGNKFNNYREKLSFMYRNVLLTDKEISILKTIINQTLHEKLSVDRNNLTIIHNRLKQIKPLNNYNQTVNYGKWA